MKDLILIGGGGHCRSCIDVIESEGKFRIIGILDNNLDIRTKILEYEVIGKDDDIEKIISGQFCKIRWGVYFIVTIGQIKTAEPRIRIFEKLCALNAKICTVISPLAYVSKYSIIGEGTIVMHHAMINSNARVGKNCIINSKALVEHDAVICNHCHISTAAVINGSAKIEESSFVGSNSVVINNAYISHSSFIKSGEMVK
jgi:sugar O-acyltransferase (sialic acid O-acetyltransferase NeuD family)